jgi:hypothetical protein
MFFLTSSNERIKPRAARRLQDDQSALPAGLHSIPFAAKSAMVAARSSHIPERTTLVRRVFADYVISCP